MSAIPIPNTTIDNNCILSMSLLYLLHVERFVVVAKCLKTRTIYNQFDLIHPTITFMFFLLTGTCIHWLTTKASSLIKYLTAVDMIMR